MKLLKQNSYMMMTGVYRAILTRRGGVVEEKSDKIVWFSLSSNTNTEAVELLKNAT
jgi:hypothetical protein